MRATRRHSTIFVANTFYAHHQHTNNSVILYASGWLQRNNAPPEFITINDEDIQALMEVSYGT